MHISILMALLLGAIIFTIGILFGWNNGKQSTISKIENETKALIGDAARAVGAFWANVKSKL